MTWSAEKIAQVNSMCPNLDLKIGLLDFIYCVSIKTLWSLSCTRYNDHHEQGESSFLIMFYESMANVHLVTRCYSAETLIVKNYYASHKNSWF